ncbi:MAG: hypothetical protein KAT28_05130 [Candidatus Aenigmarchaeota archaeon]|nr:hypothetical protein [Candidatus Aenigmarchaeota archaeon]
MLDTILTILWIASLFSSLILLGIIPSHLVYLLYYKIFGKFLTKKRLGFLTSLSEYKDLKFFEVILPMGFGAIMLTAFKPLDALVMSYWNIISLPIFAIYFYYSSRLFPKYYHKFKTKK